LAEWRLAEVASWWSGDLREWRLAGVATCRSGDLAEWRVDLWRIACGELPEWRDVLLPTLAITLTQTLTLTNNTELDIIKTEL
jgi:hypothetical protein